MIEFYVPLKTQPKQSFQASSIRPFPNKGVAENANTMALFMREHIPDKPLEGPLRLSITYQYPWRKSEKKKNLHDSMWKYTRPDHGNLTKQIEDVMESMGFFGNDAQIASSRVDKFWSEQIGVWITLEELESHGRRTRSGKG